MDPRLFFNQVRDSFVTAAGKTGSINVDIELGGRPLRISFASPILHERLSRALVHRRPDDPIEVSPSDTILVWDAASSGISPPDPPWGPHDYREKGLIRGYNTDGIHTSFHVGPGVLSMYDDQTGTGIYWTADGVALPDYQIGSPLLIVLQWWAEQQGLHLIHAGAVGTDLGGVLLVGAGGSGKSTTALSCVDAPGFRYVSDDYCLLETSMGDTAHSLYNTGKLDAHSLTILPQFSSIASNRERPDSEKAIFFLSESRPEALEPSLPVKAIVCPTTGKSTATTFLPASPALALRALAPSTIFQLTGAGSHTFQDMAALTRRLPCYELRLSPHMRDAPAAIAEILKEAS